jgi:hypothetical protein
MNLAQAVDSPGVFERLCSTAMDSPSLGARVLAALIPAHYPDLNALHRASGMAYSTLHAWKRGASNPRWEQVEKLAALVGRDPFDIVAPSESASSLSTLRHHPDFAAACGRAQRRYSSMPAVAYELAGDMAAAQWPEHLDEHAIYRLAEFWFSNATDRRLIEAETSAARREMEAEDSRKRT